MITAIAGLGAELSRKIAAADDAFETVCRQAYLQNNWFTNDNIKSAFSEWSANLSSEKISGWLADYQFKETKPPKRIGVINAGNIPLVGLHDMISVLLSGHHYIGKNAFEDKLLLPYVVSVLISLEDSFEDRIHFTERLTGFDAVIATGSNNSTRYFESYFGKYPHIIRRNRNAAAVLSGKETKADLEKLGNDIFSYFGLGCRNVSKIFVPEGYDFKDFFEAMYSFSDVMQHNKYMNNFDYNNAMLLMKQIPFLQNGFLIIREDERIASPIAVLHYEKYRDAEALADQLDTSESKLQCVVTNQKLNLKSSLGKRLVKFGETQSPALSDYADGVDTMEFLLSL